MGDTIKVSPTQLTDTSYVAKTGSSDTNNLSQTVDTALADVVTSLMAVDILSSIAGSLESFGTGLLSTLACFATGLNVVGTGLAVASTAFKGLDAGLAATLSALGKQLPYYTGYDTTVTMPVLHVPTTPITITTTNLTFKAPAQPGGFWSSVSGAWDATTHFVAQHGEQIGLFAAGGLLVVGGLILTPVTLGGSDVAGDTGAAALFTMAAAAG